MTSGLSRRSSVPVLNDRPSMPTFGRPSFRILSTAWSMCTRLLASRLVSIGSVTSCCRAMVPIARRSFGRQEPPNAKPGLRYALEMFSCVSAHTSRITSCESMPSACAKRPISLANVIFRAWKALQLILSVSATRMSVTMKRAPRCANNCAHLLDRGLALAAHDRVRRVVVVVDRACPRAGIPAGSTGRSRLPTCGRWRARGGLDHLLDRAGLHGRADDDGVEFLLGRERGADLLRQPQDGRQVLAAVRRRRCTHADEGDLGVADRMHGIAGDRDAARLDHVTHQLLDALFQDRRLLGADQVELGGIDVDADDAVTVAREARERHRAHVAQPEDADAPRRRLAAAPGRQWPGSGFILDESAGPRAVCIHVFAATLSKPSLLTLE